MTKQEASWVPLSLFAPVERWCELRLEQSAHAVQARSALAGDDRASDPYQVSHGIWRRVDSAIDHLNAIRLIVVDAGSVPTYALFTLMRAVIENAASAQWIARPPQRPERIRRRLHLETADIKEARTARALAGLEPGELDHLLGLVHEVGDRNGLDRASYLRRKPGWGEIVRETGPTPQLANTAEFTWKLCSGFAHADQWPAMVALTKSELATSNEKVAHLSTTAPVDDLPVMIEMLNVMIRQALRLFDQRRKSSY